MAVLPHQPRLFILRLSLRHQNSGKGWSKPLALRHVAANRWSHKDLAQLLRPFTFSFKRLIQSLDIAYYDMLKIIRFKMWAVSWAGKDYRSTLDSPKYIGTAVSVSILKRIFRAYQCEDKLHVVSSTMRFNGESLTVILFMPVATSPQRNAAACGSQCNEGICIQRDKYFPSKARI